MDTDTRNSKYMDKPGDIIMIPFAAWEPDKAVYNGKQAAEARGVIPASDGYIPLPQLRPEPQIDFFPDVAAGAASFYDDEGNPITLIASKTYIYQLVNSQSWHNVSAREYVSSMYDWDFAKYGNLIFATNGEEPLQYAEVGLGGVPLEFKDVPGAPVSRSVEVIREFIMLGGVDGTKIRWSAIGSPLDWPAPGSNDAQYKQSDEQDFPDTGQGMSVVGGLTGIDVLIFTERAIYRGNYVGSPYFFTFSILDKSRGTVATRSVVTGNSAVYFLSEQGFFATDGSTVKNIGQERVNRWFRATCELNRRAEVVGAIDPINGIIVWSFPSLAAPEEIHDYIIIYSPELDKWSYARVFINELFSDLSRYKTLESLDEISPLDDLPYPLDSRVWRGGVPGLGAIMPINLDIILPEGVTSKSQLGLEDLNALGPLDTLPFSLDSLDDNASNYKLSWFAGLPMDAYLMTSETGGERTMVHGIRPLVDGAKCEVNLFWRDFQREGHQKDICSPVSKFDGFAYAHRSCRYLQANVVIPEGQAWTHAIGVDLLAEKEGTR